MNEAKESTNYPWTVAATAGAIVGLIPGLLIGMVASKIYIFMVGPYFHGGILNYVTNDWFEKFAVAWFPGLMHYGIATLAALYGSTLIMKKANPQLVAFGFGAILVAFFVLFGVFHLSYSDFGIHSVEMIANMVGGIGGVVGFHIESRQRR